MKLDRIMWGIVLLFIGGVLLLENFGIIDFYWSSVWRFWPIFLIIAGINILFSKSKSQLAGVVSVAILIITLGLLFFKGQRNLDRNKIVFDNSGKEGRENDSRAEVMGEQRLAIPYGTDSIAKKTILNISGAGTSFDLKGHTDSLISVVSNRNDEPFLLINNLSTDSITTLNLKPKGRGEWKPGGGDVDVSLNIKPNWEIYVKIGAGRFDFDLADYKVRTFNFDGGAAALELKVGSLLPITDVNVKTGMAEVKINIPTGSGCQIRAKTGLSSKEFTGFIKVSDNIYETPGYKDAKNKIFINFDGGLSSFEVNRY